MKTVAGGFLLELSLSSRHKLFASLNANVDANVSQLTR